MIAVIAGPFMNSFRKIYKIFSHTLLLSVYLMFFFVQLFFNFEAFSNAQFFLKCPSLSSYFSGHPLLAGKIPVHAAPRSVIRLNKRFQQANSYHIELISTAFSARYESVPGKIPCGHYLCGLTLLLFPDCNPLRGPPYAG